MEKERKRKRERKERREYFAVIDLRFKIAYNTGISLAAAQRELASGRPDRDSNASRGSLSRWLRYERWKYEVPANRRGMEVHTEIYFSASFLVLEVSEDICSHSLPTRLVSVAALLRRSSPSPHPLLRLLSHVPDLSSIN